jgi:hypothetical protein
MALRAPGSSDERRASAWAIEKALVRRSSLDPVEGGRPPAMRSSRLCDSRIPQHSGAHRSARISQQMRRVDNERFMVWRVLADAVVGIHIAFVLFVVFGGLLVLRWPAMAWLHLPAVVWGAWVELAGSICPLTPLENLLRARGGGAAYEASFVERYLLPALYPSALTRELQFALGAAVLIINAVIYGRFLAHRRRRQRIHSRGA